MDSQSVSFIAYDTFCSVCVAAMDGRGAAALNGVKKLAMDVEATLSMFDPQSELSRMCASYTVNEPYPVSDMLFGFLQENLAMSRRTEGAFDPTVGPLVKLWNFLAAHPEVPEKETLDATLLRVGYENIRLDPARRTVTFGRENMLLDPGAGGKGFALEVCADYLRAQGVKNAVLNYGGNLFALGGKLEADGTERPWKAAIRHPDDPEAILGTVPLADSGVATSSWYEHCFQKDGEIYHHILDPRTGLPKALAIKSVSIISSSGFYTDLVSTAFFLLSREKGAALCEALRKSSGARIEFVGIAADGEIFASPDAGFEPANTAGATAR